LFRLALKLLFRDTTKYLMLVVGLVFASFLMCQQAAVFCGLMRWTASTMRNVPAPIWVVEQRVEQINETTPMRETDVSRIRSVDAVGWAYPVYTGMQRVRLADGNFKLIQLIGIDSAILAGAPKRMIKGNLEDLRLPHAVIIDDLGVQRLSLAGKKLDIGDVFEINDQEARVVGICEAEKSFTGGPYVFCTYDRAVQYAPAQRKMLSAVLVSPKPGTSNREAAKQIQAETGLRAFVNEGFTFDSELGKDEFSTATIWWYVKNTGIPFSFGITMLIGFIVGISICCQTFYAFVVENTRHLGALKAMGVSNGKLCLMLLFQAVTTGVIGFGVGMFLVQGFGRAALMKEEPPFYLPTMVPFAIFGIITGICCLAALLGMIRVARLEPAMVFRS
jgi:putative ABC transport system permease protein